MKKERDSNHYDLAYSVSVAYKKEPEEIVEYYKMWKSGAQKLMSKGPDTVIDLGCGAGHFARVLEKMGFEGSYHGFDFSKVSIGMARGLVNSREFNFTIADLYKHPFWKQINGKTIFTAFEFLEHIEGDLDVISKIPKGSYVIFSVPSFDSRGHVRHFLNEGEVLDRYSGLINIEKIEKFKKAQKDRDDLYIYLFAGVKR